MTCKQKYYRKKILHRLPALKTLHHWLMKFNNYLRNCAFHGPFNLSYSPLIPAFANLLHMFQPHLSLFSLIQLFLFELYTVGQIGKIKTCSFMREHYNKLTQTAKSRRILKRHIMFDFYYSARDELSVTAESFPCTLSCDGYHLETDVNPGNLETLTPPSLMYRTTPVVIWQAFGASVI